MSSSPLYVVALEPGPKGWPGFSASGDDYPRPLDQDAAGREGVLEELFACSPGVERTSLPATSARARDHEHIAGKAEQLAGGNQMRDVLVTEPRITVAVGVEEADFAGAGTLLPGDCQLPGVPASRPG